MPNRLFISHLQSLEGPVGDAGPQVLIVQKEKDREGPLCAVERIKSGLYALCRLADRVKADDIRELVAVHAVSNETPSDKNTEKPSGSTWWTNATVVLPEHSAIASTRLRKAPRLSICREDPLSDRNLAPAAKTCVATASISPARLPDQLLEHDSTITSADDVYTKFIAQYLETLYLSKIPLAFFAKGPVSRAKAAFNGPQIDSTGLSGLVQFLRALILSSSAADKKYRDKLPEALRNLPPQGMDEVVAHKKRRKKRLKPDKYGMLPDEEDHFAKWWHADDANVQNDENAEQCLKRRSAQLRTRETFMQVILILEVLSVEASPEFKGQASATKDESQAAGIDSQTASKPKTKKADDLSVSLELLLDKLGIWHSLDSGMSLDTIKQDGKSKDIPNELHNFCVEVVIPFYLSRVPEHASTVNKKLGGPSTSSNKPRTISRKPGEPESRQRPDKKPRDPLSRVASEANYQSSKPARTFVRSCTDSFVVPGLKREASEISLAQIPSRDLTPAAAAAAGPRRSASERMRVREVDFSAIQRSNDAKLKKRQEVEERLKEAITALKRPNSAQAGREIADVSEQRRLIAQGRSRTSQSHAQRKSQTIHVAATPKGGHRTHDAIAATPHHIPAPAFVRAHVQGSGASLVLSSSMKPPPSTFHSATTDVAVPQTGHRPRHAMVEETPSKGKARFAPLPPTFDDHQAPIAFITEDDEAEEESPDFPRATDLLCTPSKPSRTWAMDDTPSRSTDRGNGKGKERAAVAATPVKERNAGLKTQGQEQKSIYEALGWDDEYEDI